MANGIAPDKQAIRDEIMRVYNSTEDYTKQELKPFNPGMTKEQILNAYYDGAVPANDIPVLEPSSQPIQAQQTPIIQDAPKTQQKPSKQTEKDRARQLGAKALELAKSGDITANRAYSANEQRDMERAMSAIANQKKETVTSGSVNSNPVYGDKTTDAVVKSLNNDQLNTLSKEDRMAVAKQAVKEKKAQEEVASKYDERGFEKNEIDPISAIFDKHNIPLNQRNEMAKDIMGNYVLRSGSLDVVTPGNMGMGGVTSLANTVNQQRLMKKYGLTNKELNELTNELVYEGSNIYGQQKEEEAKQYGEAHPLLGSLASLRQSAVSALGAPMQIQRDLINGTLYGADVSPYADYHLYAQKKDASREGVKENINSGIGKGAYDIGMGLGDFAISAIPSVATGGAVPVPLLMAMGTANEASTSALERGSNALQASLYGIGAGATDYVLNAIGLDKAKGLALDKLAGEGIVKALGRNALAGATEAGENVIQDLVQTGLDEIINNKNSELRTTYNNYLASGMSVDDALAQTAADYAKQILTSAGTGFAMGSAMQGGTTLTNDVKARVLMRENAKSQRIQDAAEAYKQSKLNPLEEEVTNQPVNNQNIISISELTNEDVIPRMENPLPEMSNQNPEVTNQDVIPNVEQPKVTENVVNPVQNPAEVTQPVVNEIPRMEEPDVGSGKMKQSRVMTNSAVNADIITPEELANNPDLQKIAEYEEHNNKRTYKQALRDVTDNREGWEQAYINGERAINEDVDVDRAMILMQNLAKEIETSNDPTALIAKRDAILRNAVTNGTKAGEFIQAFAKYANTPEEALLKATNIAMEQADAWKSRNVKRVETNNRIAKALSDMGHKPETVERVPLTHNQLKERVKATIEKEMGSIAKQLNDSDIEYLTILAENKDIPVWQITDEIEHKLKTGEWYTLDESIEAPKRTNQKLQNALNKLVNDEIRPEPERKTIDQYREEVRNTLEKEFASLDDFTDSDVNYLANLMEQGATTSELADALNTKMATGTWGITAETQQKVNDIFDLIRNYDENSKEFVEGQAEAFRLLANEIAPKASAIEKFDAWRYMAMLGNPKTMFRNWIGNKLFSAVTGASNNLAALMEAGTDATIKGGKKLSNKLFKTDYDTSQGIQRTKAVLNPVKDSALIKGAYQDGFGKRFRQFEGSKYEKPTKDAILQQRETFDSKALQLYERAVDAGISDTKAVAQKYATSMAGYLKANGFDDSVFDLQNEYDSLKRASKNRDLLPDEVERMNELKPTVDALEKARDYALKQAEYATFHTDNVVAQILSNHIKDWKNGTIKVGKKELHSPVAKVGGYAIEGVLPFKKTPANILKAGFEYSPLGALKSIKETGKLIYENTGSRKGNLADTYKTKSGKEVSKTLASDVIESWSKAITGSMLAYLGYYLFDKGVLTSSTTGEKYQDQKEGKGNYAININGHTYTLDWAAPGVMPLLLGAEIKKINEQNAVLDQEWYESPDRIMETANALLDPIFETSMMSGVKDALQTAARQTQYNENGAIGGIGGALLGNALTGYATQAIPTALGQVARTVDPIRRSTDTVNSGILGEVERQGRKVMNKLPFLSMFNTPYVDAAGNQQLNSPFESNGLLPVLGNFAYQAVSPGYYSKVNQTDADRAAREAYNGLDKNGKPIMDSKVFADWKSTKKINGEKLDPQQMLTYRTEAGKANDAIRTELAHSDWFNNLSASERTDILKSVNTLTDKIGQHAVVPESLELKDNLKSFVDEAYDQRGFERNNEDRIALGANAVVSALEAKHNPYGLDAKVYNQLKNDGEDLSKYEGYEEARTKYDLDDSAELRDAWANDETHKEFEDLAKYKHALKEKGLSAYSSKSVQMAYESGQLDLYKNYRQYIKEKGIKDSTDEWVKYGGKNVNLPSKSGSSNQSTTNSDGSPNWSAYGLSGAYLDEAYNKAKKEIPKLTAQVFADTYKAIDTNGKSGLSMDEMTDHFNRVGADEQYANDIWNAYGKSNWKQIPVLVNGKWTHK